ncbi:hypothetical protein BS732_4462 [Bacillus subtilis MB73/2]|nr:hypothetical protein BS732_4462 [Bacillus subtilis MB73/2]
MSAPGIRLQTSCDRLRELHVSEVFTVITETRDSCTFREDDARV